MKKSRFSYGCYRVIRWLVWLFYPKIKVEGQENLPEGGCILVGNHAQMHGPVCGELYVPGDRAIWCNWEMMVLKEVPVYAYQDSGATSQNISAGFLRSCPMSSHRWRSASSTTPTPSPSIVTHACARL